MHCFSKNYRNEAFNQLKADFRFSGVFVIRKALRENNFHYTPAYLELSSSKHCQDRKSKRSDYECAFNLPTDEFLLQEVIVIIKSNN